MKKMTKRAISLMLTAVLAIGVAGCGKGSEDVSNPQNEAEKMNAAKQYVYKAEQLNAEGIFESEEGTLSTKLIDGKLYMLTSKNYSDEFQGTKLDLVSMNPDGSGVERVNIFDQKTKNPYYNEGGMEEDIETIPYTEEILPKDITGETESVDEDTAGETVSADEDTAGETENTNEDEQKKYTEEGYEIIENIWVNSGAIGKNQVALIVESSSFYNDADGNYMPLDNTLELLIYDFSGNEKGRIVLNDDQNQEYMYVNYMCINDDGMIAMCCETKIMIYDPDGKPVIEVPVDTNNGSINSFFFDKSGVLCYVRYNYSGETAKADLNKIDPKTKQTEEGVPVNVDLSNYSATPGIKYDLFLKNTNGAFGYNFGDAEVTPIMDYINSDIDSSNVNNLIEMDDSHILMICQAENWQDPSELYLLTYVKPEDIKDRAVVSIGCNFLGYEMRKRVVDYNKNNEDYRITVTDYSQYNTTDDYLAGQTKLNNDIIAGKMPDILILDDYSMPVDSYIAKGLFADIKEMIENDPELNVEDYFANVFDGYSVDGKMYRLVTDFSIQTIAGKTSIVGDKEGWTMDELKALMAKYPDSSVFGTSMTRDSIMWMILMYSGNQFVDSKTGKCHFDSDEFVNLLEFMKQFPKEFDYESLPDNWWMEQENAYRSGKTLLMSISIGNAENYIRSTKGQFGEEVTLIGFPANEGLGAVIMPGNSYAISAKSKNKEGAWDFLRYYLTKDYQSSDELEWNLPVMKSEAMKNLEKGMERPYWEDEDGNKEYYDYTYWNGDTEVIIDPLTREEVDKLYDYISKVDKTYYYDEELSNIINEEAAAFFEGQKSAKDVANIIQNRVQLYINESR